MVVLTGVAAVYLGSVSSNRYGANSTVNQYGSHGSKDAIASINNPYGKYGSEYATSSARNPYAFNPPVADVSDGQGSIPGYRYITTDPCKSPNIDTEFLVAFLRDKGGR